jgi:hypothetical protein
MQAQQHKPAQDKQVGGRHGGKHPFKTAVRFSMAFLGDA